MSNSMYKFYLLIVLSHPLYTPRFDLYLLRMNTASPVAKFYAYLSSDVTAVAGYQIVYDTTVYDAGVNTIPRLACSRLLSVARMSFMWQHMPLTVYEYNWRYPVINWWIHTQPLEALPDLPLSMSVQVKMFLLECIPHIMDVHFMVLEKILLLDFCWIQIQLTNSITINHTDNQKTIVLKNKLKKVIIHVFNIMKIFLSLRNH